MLPYQNTFTRHLLGMYFGKSIMLHHQPPLVKCRDAYGNQHLTKQVEDGMNHINIYSESKTELGRKLTNFSKSPFTHPVYGSFMSMEGYWYWLATGRESDAMRTKWGIEAKTSGQGRLKVHYDGFKEDIIAGLHCKLAQNPQIYDLLMASSLPFRHYYVFSRSLKDAMKGNEWWVKELEDIRRGKPLMFKDQTCA